MGSGRQNNNGSDMTVAERILLVNSQIAQLAHAQNQVETSLLVNIESACRDTESSQFSNLGPIMSLMERLFAIDTSTLTDVNGADMAVDARLQNDIKLLLNYECETWTLEDFDNVLKKARIVMQQLMLLKQLHHKQVAAREKQLLRQRNVICAQLQAKYGELQMLKCLQIMQQD